MFSHAFSMATMLHAFYFLLWSVLKSACLLSILKSQYADSFLFAFPREVLDALISVVSHSFTELGRPSVNVH